MPEGLKARDIINFNGWPARVDSVPTDREPLVVQSLGADDFPGVGVETLRSLGLSDATLALIAQKAGMLELLVEVA